MTASRQTRMLATGPIIEKTAGGDVVSTSFHPIVKEIEMVYALS